jgi:hypothetical protein
MFNMKHLSPTLLLVFSLLISLGLPLSGQGISEKAFREAFDPYLGVWQGEYRIYSERDELLNQFKVNRNYWWDGSVLMGRVSYDFGGVKKTYFHRILLSQGTPFSFITDRIDAEEIRSALSGEIMKGTVIWTRVLPKEGLPVRISERITQDAESPFIEFWGTQEALDAAGNSMLVRIEGFLTLMDESREFVTASDPATTSGGAGSFESEDGGLESEPLTEELEFDPEPEEIPPSPAKANLAPKERSDPDPELQEELQRLNVIGINEADQSLVVDYFLYYQVGDRIGTDKACFFAGIDAQYLYFEDSGDNRYRIPRKDKTERFQ